MSCNRSPVMHSTTHVPLVPPTILVLHRTSPGNTLYIPGRDICENEHVAEFNKDTCRWTLLGEAAAVHHSTERQAIIDALAEWRNASQRTNGGDRPTPHELG